MAKITYNIKTKRFALNPELVSQEDKAKAREKDQKLRAKLKVLWANFRNVQKTKDNNRIAKAKSEIDDLTHQMLAMKDIGNTQAGKKPVFKYEF